MIRQAATGPRLGRVERRRRQHGRWEAAVGVVLLVCVIGLSLVVLQPAVSQTTDNEKQVRIGHATSSETNPYVSETPAIENNGDLKGGHLNHEGPVFPGAKWGTSSRPTTT